MDRRSILEYFVEQVSKTPSHTALIDGEGTVSFDAINRAANSVANYLRPRRIGPGCFVGVGVAQGRHVVPTLLGVMKAGAAYVYLDPSYPIERRRRIAVNSGLELVIADRCDQNVWAANGIAVVDDVELGAASQEETGLDLPHDRLMSVLYTSGTSGEAKGVPMSASAALHRLLWMWDAYPFQSTDVTVLHRSASFVGSHWDVFGGLLRGVPTLVIDEPARSDPREFLAMLIEHRASFLAASPSRWRSLIDESATTGRHWETLRVAIVGGESIDDRQVRRFCQRFPGVPLLNHWALTECNTVAVCDLSAHIDDDTMPAGRPLPGVHVDVCDDDGRVVDTGVTGELYVAGPALANGYLNRPELTAQKFVQRTASGVETKFFRTGDAGRRRADGLVEITGRVDRQVNIRGFRVELGDVETALLSHPAVMAAVARVQQISNEDGLCAYLSVCDGVTPEAIREHISRELPYYMVPARLVIVPGIPLTPHGKPNFDALLQFAPDLPVRSAEKDGSEYASRTLDALKRIWIDVMQLDHEPSATDSFVALGGHSLLAMQIVARVQETFGVALSLSTFFEKPTLGDMAAALDREAGVRANLEPEAPPRI